MLAVGKLEGEAGQRDQDKADEQQRHEAPQQLGVGQMAADDRAEVLPVRPRESESLTRRTHPRHSVPLTFSCFEPEKLPHLRIALIALESMMASSVQRKPVEIRLITR